MTKDNLGNEQWQSDQARIVELEAQVAALANTVNILRHNYTSEYAARVAAEIRADSLDMSIAQAVELVEHYGMTGGEHHQQWLIDQVLRAILGEGYDVWVEAYNRGDYVKWDTGIAP